MACYRYDDCFVYFCLYHEYCRKTSTAVIPDPGWNTTHVGFTLGLLRRCLLLTKGMLFFFMVMISVLVTSEKTSNKAVWATLINNSGWSSDGVSFCLGFLTPAFALAGPEGVVHLSAEAHQPHKYIPQAMIWAMIINGMAGFAFILTILYSIRDPESVLTTNTGYPIIEVFHQATNNRRAATALTCSFLIIFVMACFGFVTSSSRLVWALARDR
jgi:choline transport protein